MGCCGSKNGKVEVFRVDFISTVNVNNPTDPETSNNAVNRILSRRPDPISALLEISPTHQVFLRNAKSKEMLLNVPLTHVLNLALVGNSSEMMTLTSGDPNGSVFTCTLVGQVKGGCTAVYTALTEAILQFKDNTQSTAAPPQAQAQAQHQQHQQQRSQDEPPVLETTPNPAGPKGRRMQSMVVPDFKPASFEAFFLGKTTTDQSGTKQAVAQASRSIREQKAAPKPVRCHITAEDIKLQATGGGGSNEVFMVLLSHEISFVSENPENEFEFGIITTDEYEVKLCYLLRAKDHQSARSMMQALTSAVSTAKDYVDTIANKDQEDRVEEHNRSFARQQSTADLDVAGEPSNKPMNGVNNDTAVPSTSKGGGLAPLNGLSEEEIRKLPKDQQPDSSKLLGSFEARYIGSVIVKEKGLTGVEEAFKTITGQKDAMANKTTGIQNIASTLVINAEGIRIVDKSTRKLVLNTRLAAITFTTQISDKKTLKLFKSAGVASDQCIFAYIGKDDKLRRKHCELVALQKPDGPKACEAVNEGFQVALLIKKLRKGNPFAAYSSTREGVAGPLWALQIHRADLRAQRVIGMGQFGEVYLAKQIVPEGKGENGGNTFDRAVKVLKGSASVADRGDFLQEAEMMLNLKHANLVQLIGVAVQQRPWLTVIEFMKYGDLLAFSTACKQKGMTINYMEYLQMSIQISAGMQYLERWNLIHMDLAARNILLHENCIVKIADFGLTRKVNPAKGYYRLMHTLKLPIKWMALESLVDKIFSIKTDVWGFGVTVWEYLSYGSIPYGDMKNIDVESNLKKGIRLNCPEGCPEEFHQLLLTCWHEDPQQRPTFQQLEDSIAALMKANRKTSPPIRNVGRALQTWGREDAAGGDTPDQSDDETIDGDDADDDDDDNDDDDDEDLEVDVDKSDVSRPTTPGDVSVGDLSIDIDATEAVPDKQHDPSQQEQQQQQAPPPQQQTPQPATPQVTQESSDESDTDDSDIDI